MQIAPWLTMQTVQTEYYFFLFMFLHLLLTCTFLVLVTKLVFNNISERLLFMIIYARAVPAQYVTVDML